MEDKMVPFQCMSKGENKDFEHNFLKIYRYLNFVNKSEANFIANEKSHYNIKIYKEYKKNISYFH